MFLVKSLALMLAVAIVSAENSTPIVNHTDPNIQEICSLLPPNKYILRPHTCANWVKCPSTPEGNDYDEGACVVGLYFDKNEGRCNYEDSVECPYTVVQKNRCEQKGDNVFLPDPESENCRGYVYCKNGNELHAKCPSDLIFDPKKAACVYKQDYKCPVDNQKGKSSPICRSVGNNQIFANEEDCTMYHECENEVLLTRECDYDMAFHYTMGHCVPKENVVCHPKARKPLPDSKVCGTDGNPRTGYVSDGFSCSGYFICAKQPENKADRHPVHMKCEQGFFFDEKRWSCRDRLNVRCPYDRCEGTSHKYVNVAGDCMAYARCDSGVTIASGICPTNYFFDERTQGCTPQNINYVACSADAQ